MHGGRLGQAYKIITALKQADDPVIAPALRDTHDLACGPVEIIGGQIDLGERITVMRVKPGRYDDQVGTHVIELGKDTGAEGFPEMVASGPGRERRVEDVAGAGF